MHRRYMNCCNIFFRKIHFQCDQILLALRFLILFIGLICYPTYPGSSNVYTERSNALLAEPFPNAISCIKRCKQRRASGYPLMNAVSFHNSGCYCYGITFQIRIVPGFTTYFLYCKFLYYSYLKTQVIQYLQFFTQIVL